MTRSELLKGVESLAPWFHKIDLPHGVTTKPGSNFGEDPTHPLPTWGRVSRVLPKDLAGKTVLDIGCNAGFYAFEARKRGAARVVGAEAQSWHVRQARFACAALGLDKVEFLRKSLYDLRPDEMGTFDVVLALGLVYHLKDIIGGCEVLFAITGDLLILETAVVPQGMKVSVEGATTYGADDRPVHPIVLLENLPNVTEADRNWFLPTPAGMAALLRSVGFVDVTICNTECNRAILTARKDRNAIKDSRRASWLGARIEASGSLPTHVSPGGELALPVRVANTGFAIWQTAAELPDAGHVCLGGRVNSIADPVWSEEVGWVSLPAPVDAGTSVELVAVFKAPEVPGVYELELDLVSVNVAWFQNCGSAPLVVRFTVGQ